MYGPHFHSHKGMKKPNLISVDNLKLDTVVCSEEGDTD